jgi:hypothetical protein
MPRRQSTLSCPPARPEIAGWRWGSDDHARDVRPRVDLVAGHAGFDTGVLVFELGENQFVLVADESEGAELVVIADQVAAPVAGADNGDFGLRGWHDGFFLFLFEPRRREGR